MKMGVNKLLAISLISIMIVASFSCVSFGTEGNDINDEISMDISEETYDELMKINDKLERQINSDPDLAEAYEQYKFDVNSGIEIAPMIGPLGGIALGISIAFALGFLLGLSVGYALFSDHTQGGLTEETKQILRSQEAAKVLTKLDTGRGIFETLLTIDSQLWSFTAPYWGLAMERSVYTMWSLTGVYNPDSLMEDSDFRYNLNYYMQNYQQVIDQVFYTFVNVNGNDMNLRDFWTSDPVYADMRIGFVWDSASVGLTSTSGEVYTDASQYITPVSGSDVAYIYTPENPDAPKTSYTIYCFGGSGQIRSLSTGDVFTLSQGQNELPNLPSGLYQFASGITYAGNFTPSSAADAAIMNGCMIFVSGTEMGYVTVGSSGNLDVYYNGNTYVNQNNFAYRVSYNSTYEDVNLTGTIKGV